MLWQGNAFLARQLYTRFLSLHGLGVSPRVLHITPITDNDAKNPHIDTEEEKRGQKEAGYESRQAKEFQVVTLRKPQCLSSTN